MFCFQKGLNKVIPHFQMGFFFFSYFIFKLLFSKCTVWCHQTLFRESLCFVLPNFYLLPKRERKRKKKKSKPIPVFFLALVTTFPPGGLGGFIIHEPESLQGPR